MGVREQRGLSTVCFGLGNGTRGLPEVTPSVGSCRMWQCAACWAALRMSGQETCAAGRNSVAVMIGKETGGTGCSRVRECGHVWTGDMRSRAEQRYGEDRAGNPGELGERLAGWFLRALRMTCVVGRNRKRDLAARSQRLRRRAGTGHITELYAEQVLGHWSGLLG